jgi:hypothetical protein
MCGFRTIQPRPKDLSVLIWQGEPARTCTAPRPCLTAWAAVLWGGPFGLSLLSDAHRGDLSRHQARQVAVAIHLLSG